MKKRLSLLLERYPVLQPCQKELSAALDLLVAAYQAGNKLLVCGNGGSAADSEHMVAELMKGFLKRRPIPAPTWPSWKPPTEPMGKQSPDACKERWPRFLWRRRSRSPPQLPTTSISK